MKKIVLLMMIGLVLVSAASEDAFANARTAAAAKRRWNEQAAAMFKGGKINPLVFERADNHLKQRYSNYDPHSFWVVTEYGWKKSLHGHDYMVMKWNGEYTVYHYFPVFSSYHIESGNWTQWLK